MARSTHTFEVVVECEDSEDYTRTFETLSEIGQVTEK